MSAIRLGGRESWEDGEVVWGVGVDGSGRKVVVKEVWWVEG